MSAKSVRDPMVRALRKPKSLRAAIDAKCWDCQGRDSDPAPRWRIGNCEMPGCPLHPVRPYQSNQMRPVPSSLCCNEPQATPGGESEEAGNPEGKDRESTTG